MSYWVFCAIKDIGLAEIFQKSVLWKLVAFVCSWAQWSVKSKLKASVLIFSVVLTFSTKGIPCPVLSQGKPDQSQMLGRSKHNPVFRTGFSKVMFVLLDSNEDWLALGGLWFISVVNITFHTVSILALVTPIWRLYRLMFLTFSS